MALSKRDSEFRLPRISYLEFKFTDMDRVLTAFFARLEHNGAPSRLTRNFILEVEAFVDYALENPGLFSGFDNHRGILERWMKTHLIDMVNRGQGDKEALAAPRPLHGYTYLLRNPRYARDYGTSQQLFEMIYHSHKGQETLEGLKKFFFAGIDSITRKPNKEALDVETQAILHLPRGISDAADNSKQGEKRPPVCIESANVLAEDVRRLLFYEPFIPRSVMVEYLKILFAFHLALYHLRLLKLIPEMVKRQGGLTWGDQPYPIGILVDVANRPDADIAGLAEYSADFHFRRIPNFVKAHYALRKLDEFGKHLVKVGKLNKQTEEQFTVAEVAALQGSIYKNERDPFFKQRLAGLLEDSGSNSEVLDPETQAIVSMDLPAFETYIEILTALRGEYHRRYITQCLDSLTLKNRPGAFLTQARTRNSPRKFILDSRLLEVLLQIAVLRPGGSLGFYSGPMRIDELLSFLRERYGLYVDQLPDGDGFGPASITERQALQENRRAFTSRLREVGFYRDLSDAYISQTVTPRYEIGLETSTTKQS